ncbi:molybdate ABC transporter permease [[Brevibacterium] flavum]|uniref:Molybdate ABC transporter permease n=1 Tax=[Brevibacterium] flavum TaxID=92706 RepID=A0A0F6WPL8_9CORY|nr:MULTISPECIES: molybdenum ABC transporter permease [Corynebacterium]AKF26280.1 molybdate ABC transporter permease [[Brevibacterium] flavum]ANE07107.1 molybdenum ABC transporter permease [Corynebacterium glutamicum]AST19516.1 molybdenum ABC transporter permease [Corynebacterium glutamicum ATCC 14067]KEI21966.1 molybdate ABC transporter permease [Corynebacterium glutamicum ATCC 14067]OKX90254.1 molybdenum ABC transporter permease [Corynebacterium glutamicum]
MVLAQTKAPKTKTRRSENHILPGWLLIPATLAMLLIIGPIFALLLQIPWDRSWELLTAPESLETARLSIGTALFSTALCAIVGFPLALALHLYERSHSRVTSVLTVLVYAPLVLSPVVSGLALTFLWGRRGLLGSWFDQVGLPIAFTTTAVVFAQVFVALPFFISTVTTALRGIPKQFEEIAATEGATRWEIMHKMIIPLAMPGIFTGMILGFARALGEYGATLTFAGNIAGVTRTIPLHIELGLSSNDMDKALGAVIMLLAVYVLIIGAIGALRLFSKVRKV